MEIRLRDLEAWRSLKEVEDARDDERQKAMIAHNERIDARLGSIESHLSKVVWLVLTGIIGGFVAFMISGGISVAG